MKIEEIKAKIEEVKNSDNKICAEISELTAKINKEKKIKDEEAREYILIFCSKNSIIFLFAPESLSQLFRPRPYIAGDFVQSKVNVTLI